MMQITEDTPPDMLAGAMDLTVHLPTGRTVKMSVERSTPMMDLLVQITTAHHLQHSGHIIQALEMAPNSGHTDKILPYKPNTPIGALDTQHVKVIPKNRSVPVPKMVSVGHQPFESTFRLQVHLPRNQLYVIRVSQNVHLEDIMKKVCEEKNLDSVKYEFRHPGNLDEVLDPKLTLSDYQITEVYIVSKGTVGLTQAFSSSDIMALRKEEERKQLQARTGGGVFSLIFKRGKPSMGSGSLSSENRSISPSHSDDSRSVTPPAIQQQILPPVSQEPQPPSDKPKAPQRKRRPAPKPPQNADNRKDSIDKPPSQISSVSDSNTSDIQQKKIDNGLTICHSRNSSDSSGYHEPSVLSDNCNTSLPRRPKSTIINEVVSEEVQSGEHSRSNGNLSKMATFSKSTTSITSRKKKAAPPPPPVLKSESSITNSEKASPVVASPPLEKQDTDQNQSQTDTTVNEDTSLDVTIKNSSSDNQIKNSVSTAHTKESPHASMSSSKLSSSAPSRQESRTDVVLEKPTTPIKESPRGSISSSKPPSQRESRSNIAPDNETTTATKESPRQSLNSSRKESKSSIVTENIETETVGIIATAPKIDQNKHIPEITPKVTSPSAPTPSDIVKQLREVHIDEETSKTDGPEELADLEHDWQYQLPSPPTAFRDSSPTNMTDMTNYDTIILQDYKAESVVTNPELFEKLRVVKESQCETETVSDFNSVVSDEDKPMLSKLTLENLEKRQSLVYNRELSTSLKIAQENVSSSSNVNNNNIDGTSSNRSSMLSELEEVIHNGGNKSLMRHNSCVAEKTVQPVIDSNLPNFKISTYDKPKKKINIFEDDSIRSNVENSVKSDSSADLAENKDFSFDSKTNYSMEKQFSINKNSYMGRSMENISYRKNSMENHSDDDVFKKPQEFAKYKPNARSNFYVKHQPDISNSVMRSESFSSNHNVSVWKPQNPVQRSKSQVALNRYRDEQETKTENEDGLSKSNSLFDVSGLQSLEVMRMIQTKLNTPSNSTEQLLKAENSYKHTSARNSIVEEESSYRQIRSRSLIVEQDNSYKQTSSRNSIIELEGEYKSISARNSISFEQGNTNQSVPSSKTEPDSTTNTKTYRYQGPPAINLSTWSERPKTKVSLKEDTDYKINSKDNFNSKVKLNGNIEIRHYSNNSGVSLKKQEESNSVSIKVNGTEPIVTQESGNVVIKIGETQVQKSIDKFSTRFINHTTAAGYRKPLANINTIDKTPRPHAVAFDSDFDISRVPIVRAVELKKPFKESPQINNTSVTQINSINNETTKKYADIYRSSESINEINGLKQTKNSSVYLSSDSINKPVLRVNSFAQNRSVPVVMGFKGSEIGNDNTARCRKSWNVPNNYGTLPVKVNSEPPVKSTTFVPNSNVPFSQITLKRIESNRVSSTAENNVINTNPVFGKVVLRNTSSQIKANNNNRFSTGSPFGVANNFESNKRYSNGIDLKETPPPPPLMPKVTSVTTKKVVKSPESSIDSRDDLLNSIRSFGGLKGLRNIKT